MNDPTVHHNWLRKQPPQKLPLPRGALLITDFISQQEEQVLIRDIRQQAWINPTPRGKDKKQMGRRVQHYGFEFNYNTRSIDPTKFLGPLPQFVQPFVQRIHWTCKYLSSLDLENYYLKNSIISFLTIQQHCATETVIPIKNMSEISSDISNLHPDDFYQCSNYIPNQLTINEYKQGHGIRPHVDTHSAFENCLAVISLGDPCMFEFRHQGSGVQIPVWLESKSLLIMVGEARYAWMHYIARRKCDKLFDGSVIERGDRISLTFRQIRQNLSCHCSWPEQCDTQKNAVDEWNDNAINPLNVLQLASKKLESIVTLENNHPEKSHKFLEILDIDNLESIHVHKLYDSIAHHWDHTRFAKWPLVIDFLSKLAKYSIVVDAGCGNGKYLHGGASDNNLFMIGSDISYELTKIAHRKDTGRVYEVNVADCMNLPYRDNALDGAISIAVLHHISSKARRIAALEELVRVVRPGGLVLVYAWALEQENPKKTIEKWTPITNIHDENSPKSYENDYFVPWYYQLSFEDSVKATIDPEYLAQKALDMNGVYDIEKKAVKLMRYCHLYEQGELERLVGDMSIHKALVVQTWYEKSNWAVVLRKIV